MRVLAYYRVSTDEQALGHSLDYQRQSMEMYCRAKGFEIVKEFSEDFSGKNFDRPAFNEMLKYIKANKATVDMVLFTKWDRYGRNIAEAIQMKDLLLSLGVRIDAVEQPLDLNNPDNLMVFSVYLTLGEVERLKIADRSKDGTVQARRNGYFTGKAPFGYRNHKIAKKQPSLIIHEEEAKIVHEAFLRVAENVDSVEAIYLDLKKKGMRITKQTFYRMFQNEVYCGKIPVPAWKGQPEETVQGKHPGIVSETIFYKAQANKMNNRWKGIVPKSEDIRFPLRNFLKCPCCGNNLTGSISHGRTKKYPYYHCRKKCTHRVSSRDADKFIIQLLKSIEIKKEFSDLLLFQMESIVQENEGNAQNIMRSLKNSIEQNKEQLNRLDKMLLSNKIDPDNYNRMSSTLKLQLKLDEENLALTKKRKTPKREILRKTVWMMSNLSKIYESADYKGKRKILSALFPEKIILEKDKCRTTKINEVLALVASIIKHSEELENKKSTEKNDFGAFVLGAGLELFHCYSPLFTQFARLKPL